MIILQMVTHNSRKPVFKANFRNIIKTVFVTGHRLMLLRRYKLSPVHIEGNERVLRLYICLFFCSTCISMQCKLNVQDIFHIGFVSICTCRSFGRC